MVSGQYTSAQFRSAPAEGVPAVGGATPTHKIRSGDSQCPVPPYLSPAGRVGNADLGTVPGDTPVWWPISVGASLVLAWGAASLRESCGAWGFRAGVVSLLSSVLSVVLIGGYRLLILVLVLVQGCLS